MRVLAVIPARGGSKGIPRKNIRLLCGKPLLQYTAEAALASALLTKTILSTDDTEIAAVGAACGLEVPFIRPSELAKDDTPTLPVIQHAVQWLENAGERFDAICLLQPTNPLRKHTHIDDCIRLLSCTDATSVVSVLAVPPKYNPRWVYLQNSEGYLVLSTDDEEPVSRRQDLPVAYHREGSVYVCRRDTMMESNSLYGPRVRGYVMPEGRWINVDSWTDWEQAEQLLCRPPEPSNVRN